MSECYREAKGERLKTASRRSSQVRFLPLAFLLFFNLSSTVGLMMCFLPVKFPK